MKKLITIVFAFFLMVGNVSALNQAQIDAVNATLDLINEQVNIIISAREDVKALLRLDSHINDDTLILAQIELAKQRAATAASDLNDLLNP